MFPKPTPRKREQHKSSDQKPCKVYLNGMKFPGYAFQRNLHRAEKERRQSNKHITSVHDASPEGRPSGKISPGNGLDHCSEY